MRRVVGAVGRVFITLGMLILLFVSYQLWGTGIYTARQQDDLSREFNSALAAVGAPVTTPTTGGATTTTGPEAPPSSTTTTTTEPPPPPPPEGEAVARIRIPKIGVDSIVVNGVTRDDLRNGPGHYPDTPLPGQVGNAAIAGHRTTYGAPFGDLDQLADGDLIQVRTLQGNFEYRVTGQLVVSPTQIEVIDPIPVDPNQPDAGYQATLTLTTCNPKYSAAQRLVIRSELAPHQDPLPAPKVKAKPTKAVAEEGLSGEEGSLLPAIVAGAIAALIGLWWWWLFHRHPRWTNWVIGAIPFLLALFVFYVFLERLLPSNY